MTDDQQFCAYCAAPLAVTPSHRGRKFCRDACRQAQWRYAKEQAALVERFGPAEVTTQDPPPPPDHGPSGGTTAPPSRDWVTTHTMKGSPANVYLRDSDVRGPRPRTRVV